MLHNFLFTSSVSNATNSIITAGKSYLLMKSSEIFYLILWWNLWWTDIVCHYVSFMPSLLWYIIMSSPFTSLSHNITLALSLESLHLMTKIIIEKDSPPWITSSLPTADRKIISPKSFEFVTPATPLPVLFLPLDMPFFSLAYQMPSHPLMFSPMIPAEYCLVFARKVICSLFCIPFAFSNYPHVWLFAFKVKWELSKKKLVPERILENLYWTRSFLSSSLWSTNTIVLTYTCCIHYALSIG